MCVCVSVWMSRIDVAKVAQYTHTQTIRHIHTKMPTQLHR